jgi:HPt (histidine-containing phosphotransfer) domain-containing protein
MRKAIEARDSVSLRSAAHALLGAAGYLTAGSTVAAALRLEQIGNQADFSGAAQAFISLETEVQSLCNAIAPLALQTHV